VFRKPKLPSHYLIRLEPPDKAGDEVLIFRSQRRTIKLKGHSFREFKQMVIPLLDGRHTLEEIESEVSDTFRPEDLRAALQLLTDQNLLQEADRDASTDEVDAYIEPQLNYFHEVDMDPSDAQKQLSQATVTLVGLGAVGVVAARALASANVGILRCVDSLAVEPADHYLSAGAIPVDKVGSLRCEAAAALLETLGSKTRVETNSEPLDSDDALLGVIQGSDLAICAVDPGMSSVIYKLNRACLKAGIKWTSAAVSAFEGTLGPTVTPYETPCYLCYQMRSVACTDNPEDEFSHLKFLDRRKKDDSHHRENLVFGVGVMGNLLAFEAFNSLLAFPSAISGGLLVVNLQDMSTSRHMILRKPWCPACFRPHEAGTDHSGAEGEVAG
jgi:adenylyltransferase/sulfurtransferase